MYLVKLYVKSDTFPGSYLRQTVEVLKQPALGFAVGAVPRALNMISAWIDQDHRKHAAEFEIDGQTFIFTAFEVKKGNIQEAPPLSNVEED